MSIRIITDDFTSATDGAGAFAELGWPTGVRWLAGDDPSMPVLSTDTDSRQCDPGEAANRVAERARQWRHADLLIKQFDSTLRGPLAAETLAAWRHSGRAQLLVAAAFPAAGRTVRAGVVHLHGQPVHETAFAHDPLNPVRQSDLHELFADHGQPVWSAPNAGVASQLLASGVAVVVVDAQTEADLDELATTLSPQSQVLWAGSTGLVRALARAVGSCGSPTRWQLPRCSRPWVLVGSRNERSRSQARYVMSRSDAAVLISPDAPGDPVKQAESLVADLPMAVRSGRCDALVATGGDTANAAARALQATGLSLVGEIEPGVPLAILHLAGADLPLITKAGGFGDEQTLLRCVEALKAGKP